MMHLRCSDTLDIMEVIQLQSIEFWEIELCEHDRLSEESSFQLQKTITDQIYWVFEALVLGHDIDVFEDFDKVSPILHEQDTGSIDIQYFYWRDEGILTILISLGPDNTLQSHRRSYDDLTVIETAKVGELLPLICKFQSYSEKIIVILYLLKFLFVLYLKVREILLD